MFDDTLTCDHVHPPNAPCKHGHPLKSSSSTPLSTGDAAVSHLYWVGKAMMAWHLLSGSLCSGVQRGEALGTPPLPQVMYPGPCLTGDEVRSGGRDSIADARIRKLWRGDPHQPTGRESEDDMGGAGGWVAADRQAIRHQQRLLPAIVRASQHRLL